MNNKVLAALVHLSATLGFLIPFANIVTPLVFLLFTKQDQLVKQTIKEVVNFQISLTLYVLISFALVFTIILAPLAIFLIYGLQIFGLITIAIGVIKSFDSQIYQYPFSIRFVR